MPSLDPPALLQPPPELLASSPEDLRTGVDLHGEAAAATGDVAAVDLLGGCGDAADDAADPCGCGALLAPAFTALPACNEDRHGP